jgi:hypothetical protein
MFLQNVDSHKIYTAPHPRRRHSSSGDHVSGYQSVIHVDSLEQDYRLNPMVSHSSDMFFSLHTDCASISSYQKQMAALCSSAAFSGQRTCSIH